MRAIQNDPGIPARLAPAVRVPTAQDRARCEVAVRALLALVPPQRGSCAVTLAEATLRERYDAALERAMRVAEAEGWLAHLMARLAAELPP